jgi:DNA-binding NarL/FixJ family response regulator
MTSHYPRAESLTTREVEILRLVTGGLTNRQLANELGISTRTVDAHLRSVYAKLGVKSRSAATRYALEHHLVGDVGVRWDAAL